MTYKQKVLAAIQSVRDNYPEEIFPETSNTLDSKGAFMARMTCDNIKGEILQISETTPFADMVREKLLPLEWGTPHFGTWQSKETPIGIYGVFERSWYKETPFLLILDSGLYKHEEGIGLDSFPTLEEAKAAAQAHYASKVLELFGIQS